MSLLKLELKQQGLVVEKQHTDGRTYLVVPSVSVIEGVMNNILYPKEELVAYPDAWNGRPLIVSHPIDQAGQDISANKPELLSQTLGFYFNAYYENDRLKGEWWLDIEKAEKTPQGREVLDKLRKGELVEQSVAVFADVEETSGEFNGVPYVGIARNIRPDHVAILLDEVGACSIRDGCGAPRVNSSADNVINELTGLKAGVKALKDLLNTFIAKFNHNNSLEENIMTREELITWILQNSPVPFSQAMLDVATDEELAMMVESITAMTEVPATAADEVENNDNTEPAPPAVPIVPPAPVVSPAAPQSVQSLLPPEVAAFVTALKEFGGLESVLDVIRQTQAEQAEQFEGLVQMLANSQEYNFTAEELRVLPEAVLRKLATNLINNSQCQTAPNYDMPYSGRILGNNHVNSNWVVYTGREEAN